MYKTFYKGINYDIVITCVSASIFALLKLQSPDKLRMR